MVHSRWSRCRFLMLKGAWQTFDLLSIPLRCAIYLCTWPLLELLFFFRVRRFLLQRTLQRPPHTTEDTSAAEDFWMRMIAEEEPAKLAEFLEEWFLGEGPLCHGNIESFVASTMYDVPAAHVLSGLKRARVARVVTRLIERIAIPDGYNARRRCMQPSQEALMPCWKPLAFYLVTDAARRLTWAVLRWQGFELCTQGTLDYWYCPGAYGHGSSPAQGPPVLLLHGVGGCYGYVPLLLCLRASRPRSAFLMPILTFCSLYTPPYDPPPPLDTAALVNDLAAALRSHVASPSRGVAACVHVRARTYACMHTRLHVCVSIERLPQVVAVP